MRNDLIKEIARVKQIVATTTSYKCKCDYTKYLNKLYKEKKEYEKNIEQGIFRK